MDLIFKGKKGVIYTVIAISLVLAMIFGSSALYQYKYREKASIVETRVDTMNSFIADLGDDISKGSRIAAYRSVVAMTDYVTSTLSFVDDAEQRIQELYYYGTIYGNSSSVMNNNTFNDWTQKMILKAEEIGLNVSFEVIYLNIEHSSPWEIQITGNVSVVVTDVRNLATWRGNYGTSATINIVGFEDPTYSVMTGNAIARSVEQTEYDGIYVTGNSTANLETHLNETLYSEFSGAPSFLMRFEGDFNASEYGIESLIDKSNVGAYYPCPEGTTNVDYLYWQCASGTTWDVDGMPSWFYLDNQTASGTGHLEKYEVEALI